MIVGIDLGIRAVYISTPTKTVTLSVDKGKTRHTEISDLGWLLEQEAERSWTCFIEEPVVAGVRNLRTTIQIAQISGLVMAIVDEAFLVPVSTWKKEVVGKGNASKAEVAAWLESNDSRLYAKVKDNQDHIDATCIRLYGEHQAAKLGAIV